MSDREADRMPRQQAGRAGRLPVVDRDRATEAAAHRGREPACATAVAQERLGGLSDGRHIGPRPPVRTALGEAFSEASAGLA